MATIGDTSGEFADLGGLAEALAHADSLGIRYKIHIEKNKWGIKQTIGMVAPFGFMWLGKGRLIFICQSKYNSDEAFAEMVWEKVHGLWDCDTHPYPDEIRDCDNCLHVARLYAE